MSPRDEVAKAAHERACGCTDSQIEGNTYWGGLADAAMAVVCSHVNQVADELRAQVKRERQGLQFDDAFDHGRVEALREAARKTTALCEEQTEDEG